MYRPGQQLDYYVGGRFRGAVFVITMSKSGKRVLVHYMDLPNCDSMWVRPDKLRTRTGEVAAPGIFA